MAPEMEVEGPGYVMFDIQPVAAPAGAQAFSATYSAEGKVARFRIEFTIGKEIHKEDWITIWSAEGRIFSVPGSDASVLLRSLAKALEAKTVPGKVRRAESISFDAAILGLNQSRDKEGGFSSHPKGGWISMKLFLADGESEVYLNLNPIDGKGEFSMKDSDYGDGVLRELAKVL